jgi:arylformamidase
MKSKYLFLSHNLSPSTPSYGDRDKLILNSNSRIDEGATANSFSFNFSTNHLGTHIDMPFHFYNNGKKVTDVEAEYWFYTEIELIDVPCEEGQIIEVSDIASFKLNKDMEILLIRTGFEKYRGSEIYWKGNPGVSPGVSEYLRLNYSKLRTIGFDFISLTSYQNRTLGKEAHLSFLNEKNTPISIVEDMKLSNCSERIKEIIISPILIEGIDSAPVTIFAKN